MSHLSHFLDYYKCLDKPGYAVLVTGNWGIGKTHQVLSALPESERVYISLFGLETPDQLHAEVFSAAHPDRANLERVVKGAADRLEKMKGLWGLAGAAPGLMSSLLRKESDPACVLIFDDLERCSMPFETMLGTINAYVEHQGFKVVLIAHDDKLEETFRTRKEKLIGQTLRAEPQVGPALGSFIDTIKDANTRTFIGKHRVAIERVFRASKVPSLRILRHCVADLERVYRCLRDEHRDDDQAMELMIEMFLAFDIEVRAGFMGEADLERRGERTTLFYVQRKPSSPDAEQEPTTPPIISLQKKHVSLDVCSSLLTDTVLKQTLIQGVYDQEAVRTCLDQSPYFARPETAPVWRRLQQLDTLSDTVLSDALEEMERKFTDREFLHPRDMLHVFSLRMLFAKENILPDTVEQTVADNKAYIDDLLESGDLYSAEPLAFWDHDFDDSHAGYVYWVPDDLEKLFQEVHDHLVAQRKTAERLAYPSIARQLLDDMPKNPKGFFEAVSETNNGPNPYARLPVLAQCGADDFLNAWLRAPQSEWLTISRALANRYRYQTLRQGNDLEEEREWALSLRAALEARVKRERGFMAFRLTRLCPPVLRDLS